MSGVVHVMLKEFRHMLHDRLTLVLTLGLPLAQLLLYGYALDTRIRHVPMALLNHDTHQAGRLLARRLMESPLFTVDRSYSSPSEIDGALRRGAIRVAIEIPADYSSNLLYLRKTAIRVWMDGADAATSGYLMAALDTIGFEETTRQAGMRAAGFPQGAVAIEARVLFNTAGRSANYLIPGLIAILVQTITALLMALSIAGERERGTLEQMLATPLREWEILGGKGAAIAVVGLAECAALVTTMRYLFLVPIEGAFLLLPFLMPLLVFTPLGLGLWIGSRARNQGQALQLANLILLPTVLLSGFLFPPESLRFPVDWVSRLLPSTYLVALMRDVVLRGTPAADLVPQLALSGGIACFLTVTGFLSARRSLRA